jgi:hypothetical protein
VINRRDAIVIGVAAVALTVLNAWKPVVIDDTAYVSVANQIARFPSDPYGFEMLWRDFPEPANHVLAPPVLPYWLALTRALLGDHLVLWKLGLLPFALALTFAVNRLSTRLVPGGESFVLFVIVMLPGVLSGFNMMTDVPALALSLLSLSIALEAIEGRDLRAALAAGLVAGFALQTRYTSVAPLAVAALYGLFHRQPRLVVCMLVPAGLVALGWEGFVLLRYGESHLSFALTAPTTADERPLPVTALGLLCLIGGTSPVIGMLCLAGLRARMSLIIGVGLLVLSGVVAIALLPAPPSSAAYLSGGSLAIGPEILPTGLNGLFVIGSLAALVWKGLRSSGWKSRSAEERSLDLLLITWVLVELAMVWVIAPFRFLAARRVLGLIVATVFLAARASASPKLDSTLRTRRNAVACLAAIFGLLFYVSDISDAIARRDAVATSAAKLADLGARPNTETIWFVGHWAFQFYADQRGFRPVIPAKSQLAVGDWLLIPSGVSRQGLTLEGDGLTAVAQVSTSARWPWSTIPGAYIGMLPLRRQPQAQVVVEIFRVEKNFVARSSARH